MDRTATVEAGEDDDVRALARRWQHADADAASELYARCRPELVRRMRRYAAEDIDAEDLAHDVWLKISASIHTFDPDRPFWPWAGRIARNHGTDTVRKRRVRVHRADGLRLLETLPDDPDGDPADALFRRSVLARALGDVPDRQRDALVAVAVLGEEHAAVAHRLGVTPNALRQLLHRGRNTLRSSIERAGITVKDLCVAPVATIRQATTLLRTSGRGSQPGVSPVAALIAAATVAASVATGASPDRLAGDDDRPSTRPAATAKERTSSDLRLVTPQTGDVAGEASAAVVPSVATPPPASPRLTPSLIDGGDLTLPTGHSVTSAPAREPDRAYGIETDATGETTQVVGVESYDQDPRVEPAEDSACHAFRQGLPGTYCRGREVPAEQSGS